MLRRRQLPRQRTLVEVTGLLPPDWSRRDRHPCGHRDLLRRRRDPGHVLFTCRRSAPLLGGRGEHRWRRHTGVHRDGRSSRLADRRHPGVLWRSELTGQSLSAAPLPSRGALRSGVAVTVALSFTPELVETIGAVRRARRMRGIPTSGLQGSARHRRPGPRGRARSLSRNSPHRWTAGTDDGAMPRARRGRSATGATVFGLLLAAVGVYGVTDAGSEFGLGLPLMAAAAVLCAVGFAARGRRLQRSRYRPDRWGVAEWLIVRFGTGGTRGRWRWPTHSRFPAWSCPSCHLAVPPLPLLPVAGILVAALPALVAPVRRRTVPASSPPGARSDGGRVIHFERVSFSL